MEPASSIIIKLGGAPKVAALVGVHRTRVYLWMRPRSVGGTGGNIPQAHQLTILRAAKEAGIDDITGESFLPRENEESES
jgi:hypothetical protein